MDHVRHIQGRMAVNKILDVSPVGWQERDY